MAFWNVPGRSRRSGHERFSDLIRHQLYSRPGRSHDDEPVQVDVAVDHSQRRPASLAAIESLTETRFSCSEEQGHQLLCAICRDPIHLNDYIKQLPCHHQYHPGCIVPWLHRCHTCPICRYELPTDDGCYDAARQAIRRIEQSPERGSSLNTADEWLRYEEISETDRESVQSELDGLNIEELPIGQISQDTEDASAIQDSGNIYVADDDDDDDGYIAGLRENTESTDDDFQEGVESSSDDHGSNSVVVADDSAEVEESGLLNPQLEEQHLYAPIQGLDHADVSYLQQTLAEALTSLDFERDRHDRLQRCFFDLEHELSRSESESLTLDEYKQICRNLSQRLQRIQYLL